MKKEKLHFRPKRFYLSSTIAILTALTLTPIEANAERDNNTFEEEQLTKVIIDETPKAITEQYENNLGRVDEEKKQTENVIKSVNEDSEKEIFTDTDDSNNPVETNTYEETES